jgi:hypothetical protein
MRYDYMPSTNNVTDLSLWKQDQNLNDSTQYQRDKGYHNEDNAPNLNHDDLEDRGDEDHDEDDDMDDDMMDKISSSPSIDDGKSLPIANHKASVSEVMLGLGRINCYSSKPSCRNDLSKVLIFVIALRLSLLITSTAQCIPVMSNCCMQLKGLAHKLLHSNLSSAYSTGNGCAITGKCLQTKSFIMLQD